MTMTYLMRRPLSTALAVASVTGGAILAGPQAAQAAGFELKEQSAIAQGNAYAGAGARSDDASMMYFNPASIARLKGYQISVGAAAIVPNGTLANGTATTGALLGGRTYSGIVGSNSGVNAVVPNIFATAEIGDGLVAGLAITSPFGLATKYPTNSIARYYALTSQLRNVNIGPTLAWQATPEWSIGGGLNIEMAESHLSNSVDFGAAGALRGLGALGYVPGAKDGIGTVKGKDTAIGWNIGVQYQPQPGTVLAFAYRSSIIHLLTGTLSYQNVPSLFTAAFPNVSATAKLPEPGSASLSFAQDIGRWTALGSVTFTSWSQFKTLAVYTGSTLATSTPENFRDTVALSLGAEYRLNEQVTLRGGTMYDQTPVQDVYRTPRIADNDRIWLSVGATWRATEKLAISGAYSHLFAANSTVALSDAGPGSPNFLKGNLNATYNLGIDIVSAQVSYKF
jgi:long-chain fatty acid transport protein